MIRTLVGYAILAVVGLVAIKLVFGLLGLAFQLLIALLWLAALGFLFYLILKVISPSTADRLKSTIRGESD